MSEQLIRRDAVKGILDRVERIHPYKVLGDRDSYAPYNEGWEDAVSLIEEKIEKLSDVDVKDMNVPVKPYKIGNRWRCGDCSTAVARVWVYCQKCGRKIDWISDEMTDVTGAGDRISCGSCGANIYYGAKICPDCGRKLNWEALEIRGE